MQKQDKWLKNDFIKIKNPSMVHENSINIECNIENFIFSTKSKKQNYEDLRASLEPFGIVFNNVYATKFSTNGQIDKPNRYMFVIDSIDSPVVWHKYDSYNKCGCQNKLFFGKKKTTVGQWLNSSAQYKLELINGMV
jgi:hypothetical protein